jgi:hypothetical protein
MDSDSSSAAFDGEEALHLCEADRKMNKSYTILFKLQIVREAKATTRRAAAFRFYVDPKRVREWISNEGRQATIGWRRT